MLFFAANDYFNIPERMPFVKKFPFSQPKITALSIGNKKPDEELNLLAPEIVKSVHLDYLNAGCDVITAKARACS